MSSKMSQFDYCIPTELSKLLNRRSYSLLVKGSPGTGKTALALTILSTLDSSQNFLYLSTRTSLGQLFQNHPWLSDMIQVKKKEKGAAGEKFITDRGAFVDARLDEQSTLFQTITDELMNTRAPFIVVDSWDAVGDLMKREAFLFNVKVLHTWRERASAKLIFTSESSEQNILDFLAEGVAVLRQRYLDGRRIREIHLSKLYGTETTKPSYFFTLNNGVFRSFEPYRAADFTISGFRSHYPMLESPQCNNPSCVPTCFPVLDKILGGGFPIHSVGKIKIGPRIDAKFPLIFLGRMIANLVRAGNPIIFQSFGGLEEDQMVRLFDSCSLDPKRIGLAILPAGSETMRTGNFVGSEGQNLVSRLKSFEEAVLYFKEKFPHKTVVAILEQSGLPNYRSRETDPESLKAILDFAKREVGLSLIVTRQPETSRQRAQIIAETQLEVIEMKGTLFLRSNVPYSQLFAIIPEGESEIPAVTLQPML